MASSYNKDNDSQDILGFYNSKKGDILYKNECQQHEILKMILDTLSEKCQKKELDLKQLPMEKIPYVVNSQGIVMLGDNEVGRLIGGGRIEFL